MRLNESNVDDAALKWSADPIYAVSREPHLDRGEPAADRRLVVDADLVVDDQRSSLFPRASRHAVTEAVGRA
jgi:hypothetical protein